MRARLFLATTFVLLAGAQVASAQDHRLAGKLDSATAHAVQTVIGRARSRELPVEPLVDRALEGVIMHQPGPRISAAVDALEKRMFVARDALAPKPDTLEIAAGADALSAGLQPSHLRKIRAVRPDLSVAVPLAVLAQLVSSGVAPSKATTTVEGLIRNGAASKQLLALNDSVRRDVQSGIRPDAALDLRGRGIMGNIRPPIGATDGLSNAAVPGNKKP